jgi:glycerol-3-phosphate cytidylyltransferase
MASESGVGARQQGEQMTLRVGYAAGAFDLFHVGHLNILRHARAHCERLIAGVVSDEMLRAVKGVEPVIPTAERAEIVRSIRYVDDVHVETVPDKITAWRDVGFTHYFKGDDWRGTPKGLELERMFAEVGVEIVYFPYTAHTSSTRLRAALDSLSGRSAQHAGTVR